MMKNILILSTAALLTISCTQPNMVIRSNPEGATLRINGEYAGKSPVSLPLNRHEPIAVMASKPGYVTKEQVFTPEMTAGGYLLWGVNNEKSHNFKNSTLTINLKKIGALH